MADVPVLEAAPKGKNADKAKDAAPASKDAPAGKKKLLIFVAIGVVALGGLGGGAFFLFGGKHDEPAKGKEKTAASEKEAQAEKEEEADKSDPKAPPIFIALDPPFVVNFEAEQLVRFLQVTAQIMSRDPETAALIKANDPIIRNDLLLLLGNQKYQTVSTREGKEALRAEALETVRKVVTASGGKAKKVEAVYFTSFVMQ